MDFDKLSDHELGEAYQRDFHSIKNTIEVFTEYHQRELLKQIISANNTETHNIKAQYQYLETLKNIILSKEL